MLRCLLVSRMKKTIVRSTFRNYSSRARVAHELSRTYRASRRILVSRHLIASGVGETLLQRITYRKAERRARLDAAPERIAFVREDTRAERARVYADRRQKNTIYTDARQIKTHVKLQLQVATPRCTYVSAEDTRDRVRCALCARAWIVFFTRGDHAIS